jgi:4-amino-4-deoxy-L-arabinose transferase-like glycosyltransferase
MARMLLPAEAQEGRCDRYLLGLLLLLSVSVRLGVLWSTPVPARDSLGFISYALWLERFGWSWTLLHQHQHPAYPLAILLVSQLLRGGGSLDCLTLQWSAQLVSVLAGVLLVWPMYALGKQLVGRAAGFWGTLLFQCLPNSGRVLSDALSDPLFLLFLAGALAWGVRSVCQRSPVVSALAGGCCGLAYLTRPEGALVLPAALLALLVGQLVPAWRQSWARTTASMGAWLVAALLVASPYYLTTGWVTNKPSVAVALTGRAPAASAESTAPAAAEKTILPPQSPSLPSSEGTSSPIPSLPPGPQIGTVQDILRHQQQALLRRGFRATQLLLLEVSRCYQYVGWLPLLLGLVWFRAGRRRLEVGFVALFLGLHAGVLWLLAFRAGYLSSRHALPLVLGSIFLAAGALWELPGLLAARWPALLPTVGRRRVAPAGIALVLLLVLTSSSLCRTLQPLHRHRAGHRAAGHWLAQHARPWDQIDDDHGWACYYANRFLQEEQTPSPPPGLRPRHYVVIQRSSHVPTERELRVQQQGGQVVFSWPEGTAPAQVLIYLLAEKSS